MASAASTTRLTRSRVRGAVAALHCGAGRPFALGAGASYLMAVPDEHTREVILRVQARTARCATARKPKAQLSQCRAVVEMGARHRPQVDRAGPVATSITAMARRALVASSAGVVSGCRTSARRRVIGPIIAMDFITAAHCCIGAWSWCRLCPSGSSRRGGGIGLQSCRVVGAGHGFARLCTRSGAAISARAQAGTTERADWR